MATPKKKSPRARSSPTVDPKAAQDVRDMLNKVRANAAKAQLPAKRTNALKQQDVFCWLRALATDRCSYAQALREIMAIFGYEVEA